MKKFVGIFLIIVLISGCAISNKNVKKEVDLDISKNDSQLYIKYLQFKSQNKKIKEQENILLELKKKYPHSIQIKKDLIDLYIEEKDYKEALNLTKKLLKKSPEDLNLLYKKVKIVESMGDFPEDTYKKIIKKSTQSILPRFKLANYYFENKKYSQAYKHYKKIYEKNHNKQIFSRLITIGFILEKYEDIYDIAMMYKNYKSVTNDEIIRYLIISKDIPKALKFVKENYSKMEYQFKAKIYFTLYYKFDKQNELQKYKKRLENMGFPKNEIEMFLAYYYLENKNSEDDNRSVEILNNLIDKGYANDDVYLYLFNYYIKNDNYDKIKQLYIAKRDDFEDNSLGVKILYSLIKENYSQSADFFDIIRWEKMENKYVFSFFYGLIEMKRYKKADNLIERIDTKIIKENNLFDYYFLKVQIKSNSNDYKGMKKNFELANKIDPDNADLLNYYGYSLLLMNKDYEKALKYLKKAYEISPKNAAINDSLGWAYFKLEQVEKAVRYINFSLNKIPNDPEVLYHKARIEEYYGRYSNSLMYLKKGKQNEDKKIEYIDFDKEINRIKNIINNNSN